jgi:hypothetical protein
VRLGVQRQPPHEAWRRVTQSDGGSGMGVFVADHADQQADADSEESVKIDTTHE